MTRMPRSSQTMLLSLMHVCMELIRTACAEYHLFLVDSKLILYVKNRIKTLMKYAVARVDYDQLPILKYLKVKQC